MFYIEQRMATFRPDFSLKIIELEPSIRLSGDNIEFMQ